MYNAEAAAALEKLKDVDCLVFDMDGVLVDVSQVIIPSRFHGWCSGFLWTGCGLTNDT
jgi:phosphoglycolate phosphatase-like HAD superfamily hydrolase